MALKDRGIDTRANPPKRIELFASYLNIVAAGCAIGAIVTAPLAALGKGDRSFYSTVVIYQAATFVLSLCFT